MFKQLLFKFKPIRIAAQSRIQVYNSKLNNHYQQSNQRRYIMALSGIAMLAYAAKNWDQFE